METLNLETFKTKIFDFEKSREWKFQGARPAIVDFYADWCGPCRALAPVLEDISRQYAGKVDVYKIDTEASPELAAMFQIRGIPSLLFIPVNGQPTMSSGALPKEALKTAIKDILDIDEPRIILN